MKFCIDCRWQYEYDANASNILHLCRHPNNQIVDPVTGDTRDAHTCQKLRTRENYYPDEQFCGPEGKWWEAK